MLTGEGARRWPSPLLYFSVFHCPFGILAKNCCHFGSGLLFFLVLLLLSVTDNPSIIILFPSSLFIHIDVKFPFFNDTSFCCIVLFPSFFLEVTTEKLKIRVETSEMHVSSYTGNKNIGPKPDSLFFLSVMGKHIII